jgi:hypothetical protein
MLAVMEEDSLETKILIKFLELLRQRHPVVKIGVLLHNHNDVEKLRTHVFPAFLIYPKYKKH